MQLFNSLSAVLSITLLAAMGHAQSTGDIAHNPLEACVGVAQGGFCEYYTSPDCPPTGPGINEGCLILAGRCEPAEGAGLYCDTTVA